ncbi:MAG: Fic family protein [Sphaerochaetaceae bacterium]
MTLNNLRQNQIIKFLLKNGQEKSSQIHDYLLTAKQEVSLVTIKRELSRLVKEGLLKINGNGAATNYQVTSRGRLFSEIDAHQYCQMEPDKRWGNKKYNFDLWPEINFPLFTTEEYAELNQASQVYQQRSVNLSPTLNQKELARFIIELSWKSSKIEGNTYTLLDTEKLLQQGIKSSKNSQEEAIMIINHKKAFQFVLDQKKIFKAPTKQNLEELHKILVQDLKITSNIRASLVGVTGSIYQPLDNQYQINETLQDLFQVIGRLSNGYDKALLALLGISYIQPFEDGNKRTSRLMTNAILLSHQLAPLSYRSVDEEEYRQAILVFYELNSLTTIKKIFIEQYKFAANNYALAN